MTGTFAALRKMHHFFCNHPLTQDAPVKAWLRFIYWQLRSRLKHEIVLPWFAGQSLAVQRGMTGATGNLYVGLHEFVDMMVPLHFLREGDLFCDVGANVGTYTIISSGVCRATTWAFEPDQGTVQKLNRNIEINHLNQLVQVHQIALGNVDGEVNFTTGLDTINSVTPETIGSTLVPQRRLDTLFEFVTPIMIKLDVEGYEEQVIRGAKQLLSNNALKVLSTETVTPYILEVLNTQGFQMAYYDPFTRTLSPERLKLSSSNSLFVRDWEFVKKRLMTANPVSVLGFTI